MCIKHLSILINRLAVYGLSHVWLSRIGKLGFGVSWHDPNANIVLAGMSVLKSLNFGFSGMRRFLTPFARDSLLFSGFK